MSTNSPVPVSDAYNTFYLVPKGLTIVSHGVRTRPRAKSFILPTGTYNVVYAVTAMEPDLNGGSKKGLGYVVEGPIGHGLVLLPVTDMPHVYNVLTTPDGDALHDGSICEDDGKEWGWYGLDWITEGDEYTRLRRMVKIDPANRAAYVR